MPPQAIENYEYLRAQVFEGGRCRTRLSAVMYHGMVRGLALMASTPLSGWSPLDTPMPTRVAMDNDPALVRLLANMVLQVQSEVQHVY